MLQKWFNVLIVAILISSLVAMPAVAQVPTGDESVAPSDTIVAPARLEPKAIGALPISGTHLVPPREEVVINWLHKDGSLPIDATEEQVKLAVKNYYFRLAKQSDTWISPEIQAAAIKREEALAAPTLSSLAIQPITATVLALAVEFGGTDIITYTTADADGNCVLTSTVTSGPLQGTVPAPSAIDNNTIWYSPTLTADVNFYNNLVFGYKGIGRARFDLTDPVDGLPGINLSGYTVQDYYDKVAGVGNVYITGTVEGWVRVSHSQGYYGADSCETGSPLWWQLGCTRRPIDHRRSHRIHQHAP